MVVKYNELSKNHQDRINTWINSIPELKGETGSLTWIKKVIKLFISTLLIRIRIKIH